MATLEKGGNAFDAAVATAFTLQVVEPHLNGPGGDVPVIVHDVRKRRTEVICGQGPAPAAATIAHYRGLGLDLVPGTGLLACCVPGTFETWALLLRDRSEEHTSELQSQSNLVCRLLLEKNNPSVYGQTVTFTATITGGTRTPTRTVTFLHG